MSRFSKAGAEALGWVFVHQRDEREIITSGTQGESRTIAGSVRAEKQLPGGGLINEEAENMGKLLERIYAYEYQREQKGVDEAPVPAQPAEPQLDVSGVPIRNVITADGSLTEEEFAAREKNDAIFDGEKMVFTGGVQPEVEEALDATSAKGAEIENRRTAEKAVGPTKQVEIDGSDAIDSPGGGPSGVLIVREDEDSFEDIQARREERSIAHEDVRVNKGVVPLPEGAEGLAGVDVSIQERGDLGSERPRYDDVFVDTPDEVEVEEQSAREIRSEAEEEKAKELRDEEGEKPEHAKEVAEAGTEAEQGAHDSVGNSGDAEYQADQAKADGAGEND